MNTREAVRALWPTIDGEMAKLVRNFPWHSTDLGPIEDWPHTLRFLIDTILRSPVPTNVRWGRKGVQIYNDAYRAVIGEAHPEPFGRNTDETWPGLAEFVAEATASARRGEAPFFRDIELHLEPGTPRFFDISYSPIVVGDEVVGVLTTLVETTDRVHARQAAQEAERKAEQSTQRLVAALESTTDCVALLDSDWRITFLNRRAVEQVAGGRNLVGRSHWSAFPDAVGTEVETTYRRVMEERVALEVETYFGPLLSWFRVNAYPTEDGGVALFFRNITADKEGKAERAALASRLEIALRAGDLGVWEWDLATGRMVYSDRAKTICGFDPKADVTIDMAIQVTHPEDYPRTSEIARRALDPAIRAKEPFAYRIIRASDQAIRWVIAHGEAVFSPDGSRAVSYIGTIQDVTEQKLAEVAVLNSEQRLRLAVEAGRMAVWSYDVKADALQGTPELNRVLGFPLVSRPSRAEMEAGYLPGEQERVRAAGRAALARGDRHFEEEYRYRWPDGTIRWLLMRAEITLDTAGHPECVVGIVMDITTRKEAEEQQRILTGELAHRVKNMLAVVQSISTMTFRRASDLSQAQAAFAGRLTALGKSHDLLTSNQWTGAPITETVQNSLAPFEGLSDRVDADGPAIMLPPTQTTSLALIIHELAVNAIKHGALSNDTGRVRISWEIDEGELVLSWTESGGPPVQPPERQGFGSSLIRASLSRSRRLSSIDYHPEGLRCTVILSIAGEPA